MDILRQILRWGAAEIMDLRVVADLDVKRYDSDFTLNDQKACVACRYVHRADQPPFVCNEETMKVHPMNPVAVFSLDSWVNSFPDNKRKDLPNCDYIFADAESMYASRKIAFCDLTCSLRKFVEPGGSKKYPEGKRNYVLHQMSSMAEWLMKNPILHHHISTATHRQYIFGVRYTDPVMPDGAATSMRRFSMTPSSEAPVISTAQRINDIIFNFVEVEYPVPLVW